MPLDSGQAENCTFTIMRWNGRQDFQRSGGGDAVELKWTGVQGDERLTR